MREGGKVKNVLFKEVPILCQMDSALSQNLSTAIIFPKYNRYLVTRKIPLGPRKKSDKKVYL